MDRSPLLSPRQQACASLAADGLQSKEIAHRLGISQNTVKQYLSEAFARLGVRNRTQLVLKMASLGLLRLEPADPQPGAVQHGVR